MKAAVYQRPDESKHKSTTNLKYHHITRYETPVCLPISDTQPKTEWICKNSFVPIGVQDLNHQFATHRHSPLCCLLHLKGECVACGSIERDCSFVVHSKVLELFLALDVSAGFGRRERKHGGIRKQEAI